MSELTARSDLAAWSHDAREVEWLLAHAPQELETVMPHVSGWSALQHAAHLTLANELVLKNLRSLAKGSGMLVVNEAAQNPEALALLAAGRLPRGRAQAPRMVVPPTDVDVPRVQEWASQLSADVDAFAGTLAGVPLPRCFVPHQMLGPLDFAQWLSFGIVHTRHHLVIAREVLDAQ